MNKVEIGENQTLKKITFLTSHSWQSNRLGGFHKFAQATCQAGIETVFFSFPRPYYALFMNQELFCKKAIRRLQKGIDYKVENSILHNVTFLTLKLPNVFGKIFSDSIMNALERFSFSSFKKFANKYFAGTSVFIFESADGILFVDRLKKMYPNAKFIYRPSDPLMYDGALSRYVKNELNIMRKADLNILVNEEGLTLYKKKILDFDSTIKYTMLCNGVDTDSYKQKYEVPEVLKEKKTALYVGAWQVEWKLIFEAAKKTPEINYVIVCPNYPNKKTLDQAKNFTNVIYMPGIKSEEVPAWITNCNVVIVPYVTNFYKNRPLGITAKYYQAMAAEKPIVSYCDTPKLKDVGISVTYNYEDFINEVKNAMQQKKCTYQFNLKEREWETITKKFIELVRNV